jgi:hypothetical protein
VDIDGFDCLGHGSFFLGWLGGLFAYRYATDCSSRSAFASESRSSRR